MKMHLQKPKYVYISNVTSALFRQYHIYLKFCFILHNTIFTFNLLHHKYPKRNAVSLFCVVTSLRKYFSLNVIEIPADL